jgi:haloalkane dehalogenase
MTAEKPSDFDYPSHYADVFGSKMHYIDAGEGDPILFLHGQPTWSYLWRNVMPALQGQGRMIALDLIGYGLSDKPDIAYEMTDHVRYIERFIEQMSLKNITLVTHDWGSFFGFHYAMRSWKRSCFRCRATTRSTTRPASSSSRCVRHRRVRNT